MMLGTLVDEKSWHMYQPLKDHLLNDDRMYKIDLPIYRLLDDLHL
jgi:hypothetical protein